MKLSNEELTEKNYYIGMFNQQQTKLKKTELVLNQQITNPFSMIKNKNFEMESLFYSHEKSYYTKSPLGRIIIDYFILSLVDILELLEKIAVFEGNVTIQGFRLPIKNPYLKEYNRTIEQLKNFEIDEYLPERIGKVLTKERYFKEMLFVEKELKELGYKIIAQTIASDTLEIINNKKTSPTKKLKILK